MEGVRVVRVKTYISPNKGVHRRLLDFTSLMVSSYIGSLFQDRPDVVVATSPQFFVAIAGWLIGVTRRYPFVFEIGDLWPASVVAVGAMRRSRMLNLVEKLELFLYHKSSAIIALTGAFKRNLVGRGVPGEKIAVVQNGVDLTRFSPQPRAESLAREWGLENKFVVGYIGTHGMAHALSNVLDTAELIFTEKNVRFMLVGDGAEREMLLDQVEKRKLTNVLMIPAQPKNLMPSYLSLCDVALVHLKDAPTFETVIPSKVFEAMAMGLPILLASPPGEAKEVVETDNAGCWVPAEDPESLARAVLELRDDHKRRNNFAEASLLASKLHTREHQARSILAVLDAAVEGRGDSAAETADALQLSHLDANLQT